MLPFDDIQAMYGGAPVPVVYGVEGGDAGGDAAQGQAAAAILTAIASIAQTVIGGIITARMTEASIYIKVDDYQKDLRDRVGHLNHLNRVTRDYRRWLRDPGHRVQWQTGAVARNHVRANSFKCPPIYKGTALTHVQASDNLSCGSRGRASDCTPGCHAGHAAPSGWYKIPGTTLRPSYNPGGHKCGEPTCTCPTHSCAFKDPIKAHSRWKWLEKGPFRGWPGQGIGNPPHLVGWGAERELGWCQTAWSYLMTVAPAQTLYNIINPSTPFAVDRDTLTSPESLAVLWPDLDGEIPLNTQIHWWNSIKEIHNLGLPAWGNDIEVPYFVFGFTPEEIREQMPDGLIRSALFSVKTLLTMQRLYTVKYLASQGVPGYAGVSYGAETEGGVGPETMKELLFDGYKEMAAGATAPGAADTTTRRWPPHLLMAAKLNRQKLKPKVGTTRFDPRKKIPDDPVTPCVVTPNYVPLAAGGVALATSLFLRYSR